MQYMTFSIKDKTNRKKTEFRVSAIYGGLYLNLQIQNAKQKDPKFKLHSKNSVSKGQSGIQSKILSQKVQAELDKTSFWQDSPFSSNLLK